ncbi:MAG TPA: NAD-dependent epimerase/dehydratase family protein [Reyranellaceae bacterium]|nr:NAD-dependent epimerase/dehydratase family protein [Reyranellaceae bacterium]
MTGGAGFIGSNIAIELARLGHTVTVLDDLSSGARENLDGQSSIRFVEGSILDEDAVAEAIDGAEVVFHLAASVGNKRSIDAPLVDSEINVLGTLKVLEAARRTGARKIVASSSAGIYGELVTLPIDEDHPIRPLTPYGGSKLCSENHCLAYANVHGLEAVCLRYFNVYGPHQRFDAYGNVIPIFVFKALAGEPITVFGDGEQTRDFVSVTDVVQANLKAGFAAGGTGAYNIGSATRISINALVEALRRISGLDLEVRHGPERPGDVRDSLADISRAKQAFGFEPAKPLDEGLGEYIAWARSIA